MTRIKINELVIFLVTIDPDTPQKVYLISDWIRNNENFKTSEKYYSLLYTKNSFSDKYFQLKRRSIYVENDLIVDISNNFGDTKPDVEGEDYRSKQAILVPDSQDFPFKIIFEITLTERTEGTKFRLKFERLSLGDPCLDSYTSGLPVCQNEGLCRGTGPKQYQCECKADLAGTNCELDTVNFSLSHNFLMQ